jgi:hypothetical protein
MCSSTGLALQYQFHPCEALSADAMSQGAAALCAGWSVQDAAAQLAAGIAAEFTAAQAQLWQQGQDTAGNRKLQPKAEQWSYPREGGPDPGAWEGYSGVLQLPPGCGGKQRRIEASTTAAATTTQCAAAGEHGSAVAELSYLSAQQVCSERSSSVLSATAPDDTALFSAQLRCLNEIVAVVETFWECLDPTVRAAACSEVLAHKDAWVSPSKDTISLCESTTIEHRYVHRSIMHAYCRQTDTRNYLCDYIQCHLKQVIHPHTRQLVRDIDTLINY